MIISGYSSINESREIITDKDGYEIIVSSNKTNTVCTITCFDNKDNPNTYYLEKIYREINPGDVFIFDEANGIMEVCTPMDKILKIIKNKLKL